MKYTIGLFVLFNFNLTAQNKLKDLSGEWWCLNQDSLYYKLDTIKFIQAKLYHQSTFTNRLNALGCRFIKWEVKGRKLKILDHNGCFEPGNVIGFTIPWKIKFYKHVNRSFITIVHVSGPHDNFEILNYEKTLISKKEKGFEEEFEKTLILKRIN